MTFLNNKKQLKIFIYIILILLLSNYCIMVNSYTNTNNLDDSTLPYILISPYQSEILNIQELPRHKISLDAVYRIASIPALVLVCCYNLLLYYNRYLAFISLYISKLFIILQRLLLPRKNSSRYKASSLLSMKFNLN